MYTINASLIPSLSRPTAAPVEQAQAPYSELLGAPDSEELDRINRMDRIISASNPVNPVHPVRSGSSLSAALASQKILDFVSVRLRAQPEEIDQIVYKLYGLTTDEIKIVEENISGGKDAKEING